MIGLAVRCYLQVHDLYNTLNFCCTVSDTLIFVSRWPGSFLLLSDGRRPEACERLPVGLWAGAPGRGGAAGPCRAQELEAAPGGGRGLLRHGQVHQTGNYNTREGNCNTGGYLQHEWVITSLQHGRVPVRTNTAGNYNTGR